jgi:putative membrane protein
MMWWGGDWGWGAWLGMSLGMLAFWGLIAWAIVILVRGRGEREAPPPPTSAEEILAARLAHGEIDVDEYRKRLEALRGGGRAKVPSS